MFTQVITLVDTTAPVITGELSISRPCNNYNGVYALANGIVNTAAQTRKWQNGFLSSYLFWMVLGLISFISYYILKLTVWH